MNIDNLYTISPIDGRYSEMTKEIREYFCEYELIKNRVLVEIEWMITLSENSNIKELNLNKEEIEKLRKLYINFSKEDADRVKEIEDSTKHDVKAIEYFIREKAKELNLEKVISFIHFGCTSEDINNLTYGIMVRDMINKAWLVHAKELIEIVKQSAKELKSIPMLSHTHGQSATPTTVGKELSVFVYRWKSVLEFLEKINLKGKLNGAVGNFNSFEIAYPNIDWISLSKSFVESLGLEYNPYTTQIESHDTLVMLLNMVQSFNMITMDFNSDMWIYISTGYFNQKVVKNEVGSSVMPHKVNPINHENSMANIRLSNSYINSFATNLPVSRMQRDLSDSSMLRNIGVAIAHSLISIKQTKIGFKKMSVNKELLEKELNDNPEILAEAIQTVLRKNEIDNAYEILKEKTRGKKLLLEDLKEWIETLEISEEDKDRLKQLTPLNYIGLAEKLTQLL